MTTLDEELAQAARGPARTPTPALPTDAGPAGSTPPKPAARRDPIGPAAGDRPRRPRQIALLLVLIALVVGTLALFFFGFKTGSVYAMSVEELVARRAELEGRRVRIDGELVVGSLLKREKPCEYRFQLTRKETPPAERSQASLEQVSLDVRFPQCVVPDNFQDRPEGGVEVTAEGTMRSEGYFEATSILAKCSSRYDPAKRTMNPE